MRLLSTRAEVITRAVKRIEDEADRHDRRAAEEPAAAEWWSGLAEQCRAEAKRLRGFLPPGRAGRAP